MATDVPVTGGDLYSLWEVAHKGLPDIADAYQATLDKHDDKVAGGDTDKFGKCFTAWQGLQEHARYLLDRTHGSLVGAQKALDIAIEQYAFVDGDNSKGLTAAGSELEGYLDKPIYDPDHVDDDGLDDK